MINIAFLKLPYQAKCARTKILKIMRLTAVLILISTFTVSARSYSQKVNLSLKNASAETVFEQIRQQTGYSFLWQQSTVEGLSPITISIHNADIDDAVKACIKDLPLTYQIHGKVIYIKPKIAVTSTPVNAYNESAQTIQQLAIHGYVNDSAGNPLSNANIRVQATGFTTHTNDKGGFELNNISIGDTLIVSYVGYVTRSIPIIRKADYLYIILKESNNELDQTIIQAYGTTTRRFDIGNISTISATEIEQQPVTNIALALQGRIPGLLVTPKGGGIPGAGVQLQIRGQNTLATISNYSSTLIYSQPLIIVDGIPTAAQNNSQTSSIINSFIAGSGLSPLNSLNPSDIESISVLKDADATSIYGSQGANGVIIITTKRGHAGKTELNVNINTGPNSPTTNLKMLDTKQYLQLRNEAVKMDGINLATLPSYNLSSFQDLLIYDTTRYTDWVKKFFNRNPMNTDVHVSVSGGSNNDSYIISGGYTRSPYNLPGDFADNRLTLHSGAHHSSQNRKFSVDFSTDFGYDKNNSSASITPAQAIIIPPDAPDMIDAKGDPIWSYKGAQLPQTQIFASLSQPYNAQLFTLNSSLRMEYEILNGLKFAILAGYNRSETMDHQEIPKATLNPQGSNTTSTAYFGSNLTQSIDVEPQLNYNKYIGKGSFSALVGGTYKKVTGYNTTQMGTNYPDDALLNSIEGAQTVTNYDGNSIYRYAGGFMRLNYVYANKYIINLTGRRDGSSNFGPNHQWGNFGSAGLGWIFSEEGNFKNALPFISFGKLSGNYGTTGTDIGTAYSFKPFWSIFHGYPPQFQGITPFIPYNLNNPDFSWASKLALNLSIDLGLFNNRILINSTWYQNRTGNQLVNYPLPYITGFTSVFQNLNATIQDRGVEFTVSSKNINHKYFTWNTTFNISTNRNKLLAFPNLASSSYGRTYAIGKSTSIIYGYKYAGINDTTGVFQFYKGDGKTITSSNLTASHASLGGDEVPIGSSEPAFYGGFGNTFTYKGLSLNIFFQFSKSYAPNYLSALYGAGFPGEATNIPALVLNKIWSGPSDNNAELQRPISGGPATNPNAIAAQNAASYFINSSGGYSNDEYVRLKTLSVSYQLPSKWVKSMHMTKFNVFLNVQNLLTFTNYKFGDPELPGQLYGLPTQRIVAGGLNFSF